MEKIIIAQNEANKYLKSFVKKYTETFNEWIGKKIITKQNNLVKKFPFSMEKIRYDTQGYHIEMLSYLEMKTDTFLCLSYSINVTNKENANDNHYFSDYIFAGTVKDGILKEVDLHLYTPLKDIILEDFIKDKETYKSLILQSEDILMKYPYTMRDYLKN